MECLPTRIWFNIFGTINISVVIEFDFRGDGARVHILSII